MKKRATDSVLQIIPLVSSEASSVLPWREMGPEGGGA